MQTQVLVVGAGPVGLTTVIGLAKARIDVAIIDAADAGRNGSRAAAIHANTLEVCGGVTVGFENGSTITAQYVVGADGSHSSVRNCRYL